jgi:trk system potassium uptake protein TrkA
MVAGVEGAIDIGHMVRMMELRGGQAKLAKLTLPERNSFVGQRIRDLSLSENTALAVVLRGGEVILPQADDVLRAGDEMLFVTGGAIDEVQAIVRAALTPTRGRRRPSE